MPTEVQLISDGAVTGADISNSTITADDIANNAVINAKIADNAVTNAKIADNAVGTAEIADNAVTNAKIADNAVGTAEIADNAVTNAKIADNAVGTAEIANNAVTTAKINFTTALVPIGGIIMWSGSTGSIPTGYQLCNGTNGTPNLQDRFIVGAGSGYGVAATGGSANATLVTHTHTGTTSDNGLHSHAFQAYGNGSEILPDISMSGTSNVVAPQAPADGRIIVPNGSHNHSLNISSEGSSATNANLPPYYALAFIMRVL